MKITSSFKYENIQGYKFGSVPYGKPRMFSHIYFLDGLLIDTGHSNMSKAVFDTIAPLPVEQIFITHHHEDHTGNLAAFQTHFKCPTYADPACVELMKKPPKISFAQWSIWGNRPANFKLQAKTKILQTSNYSFELISVPGHAVDMVCLYEANRGWLFSADLWVKEYIRYFMDSESMWQQIVSIRRVLELDFDVLLCGHNPQFENGKEKLAQKLQFLEDFYGRAATLYHQDYTASAIMKKMNIKEDWATRILSTGQLSAINMVKAVIRDEESKQQ